MKFKDVDYSLQDKLINKLDIKRIWVLWFYFLWRFRP